MPPFAGSWRRFIPSSTSLPSTFHSCVSTGTTPHHTTPCHYSLLPNHALPDPYHTISTTLLHTDTIPYYYHTTQHSLTYTTGPAYATTHHTSTTPHHITTPPHYNILHTTPPPHHTPHHSANTNPHTTSRRYTRRDICVSRQYHVGEGARIRKHGTPTPPSHPPHSPPHPSCSPSLTLLFLLISPLLFLSSQPSHSLLIPFIHLLPPHIHTPISLSSLSVHHFLSDT